MNLDTFEKLQLKEVKELIKEHCVSSLGKMLIDKLQPSGNYSVVRRKLEENKEARQVLENSNHIPLEGLFNIFVILSKSLKIKSARLYVANLLANPMVKAFGFIFETISVISS